MDLKVCQSCNKEVNVDYLEFKCPNCLKSRIVRCKHCRETAKTYKCAECGFEGP